MMMESIDPLYPSFFEDPSSKGTSVPVAAQIAVVYGPGELDDLCPIDRSSPSEHQQLSLAHTAEGFIIVSVRLP